MKLYSRFDAMLLSVCNDVGFLVFFFPFKESSVLQTGFHFQSLLIFFLFSDCHMIFFQKQAAKQDEFQLFAEKVRDHKDLVSRWAVLQETRVEYFRGKDFVSFLRNHPELKDILESDRNLEAEDIANILLRKNLLVRCDRVVKTVRPGKKKLSTWPAHLEIFSVS